MVSIYMIKFDLGRGDEFDAIAASVLVGASLFESVGSVFPVTVQGH
jgi:predicted ABC-type sugar transport system permease subunit